VAQEFRTDTTTFEPPLRHVAGVAARDQPVREGRARADGAVVYLV
jgi:hypothetical protein